jgi:hypothetical protein
MEHPQASACATSPAHHPFSYEWNDRARQWKWEVNLLGSPAQRLLHAGRQDRLLLRHPRKAQLEDDEVAAIMGHEVRTRCASMRASAWARRPHQRRRRAGSALLGLGNVGRGRPAWARSC